MIPVRGFWIILIIFLLFVSSLPLNSQENNLPDKWTANTAFLMPAGKWESGIFQTFRFGLNDKIELRSNALLMPVLPNAGVKFSIRSGKKFLLASEHTISCPAFDFIFGSRNKAEN